MVDGQEILLADIPGLIEGASEGAGLGFKFLRHVDRCAVILHLIDGTQEDVASAYQTIRKELENYSPLLAQKPEIVALNKCDSLLPEEIQEKEQALNRSCGKKVFVISGFAGIGLVPLLRETASFIHRDKKVVLPNEDHKTENENNATQIIQGE